MSAGVLGMLPYELMNEESLPVGKRVRKRQCLRQMQLDTKLEKDQQAQQWHRYLFRNFTMDWTNAFHNTLENELWCYICYLHPQKPQFCKNRQNIIPKFNTKSIKVKKVYIYLFIKSLKPLIYIKRLVFHCIKSSLYKYSSVGL